MGEFRWIIERLKAGAVMSVIVAIFWLVVFLVSPESLAKTSSSSSSKDKTEEKQSASAKKKVSVPNPGTKKLPEQKSASPALKKVSTPAVKKSPAPSSTATQKSSSPAPVTSTPAPAVSTPKSNPLKVIPAQKSKSSGFGSVSTPKSKSLGKASGGFGSFSTPKSKSSSKSLGKASGGFGSFSKPKSKSPAISPGFGVQPATKSTAAASVKTPISQKPGGVNNRGTPEEIAQKLHGRIKLVGPNEICDYIVRITFTTPDLRVRLVDSLPNGVGEWQMVKKDDPNYDYSVYLSNPTGPIPDLTVFFEPRESYDLNSHNPNKR